MNAFAADAHLVEAGDCEAKKAILGGWRLDWARKCVNLEEHFVAEIVDRAKRAKAVATRFASAC